jgi:hypothetical protein
MTLRVELPKDVEAGLLQAHESGVSPEVYAAQLLQAEIRSRRRPAGGDSPRKSLVELFEPLRGLELDFGRNGSGGQPLDL